MEAVFRALKRRYASENLSENKPIAVFLFAGGSGTGKTELAKQIAVEFYGSESRLIFINMSNYDEKHKKSLLLGAPPGYVGFGNGGELTNALKKTPFGVILLDEIEKADKDILRDLLLPMATEGVVVDGSYGTKYDISNMIVILTSNLGSSFSNEKSSIIGFSNASNDQESYYEEGVISAVYDYLPNEIQGRLDEIILFKQINKEIIDRIWERELAQMEERLSSPIEIEALKSNVNIEITSEAKSILMEKTLDRVPFEGARAVKKVFKRFIEDVIVGMVADSYITLGSDFSLCIDYDSQNQSFTYDPI